MPQFVKSIFQRVFDVKKYLKNTSGIASKVIWALSAVCGLLSFFYYLSTGNSFVVSLGSSVIVLFLSMFAISVTIGALLGVVESVLHPERTYPPHKTSTPPKTHKPSIPAYTVLVSVPTSSSDPVCKISRSAFVSPTAKNLENICSYVVLDTETTGLDRKTDRIVEISLARYEDGAQVDLYTTLVDPQIPIPPAASRVNHITDADVAGAPTFAQVWPDVLHMMQGALIVGHNVTFDLDMIGYSMPDSAAPLDVQYLDTLTLSKKAFPGRDTYKLASLVKDLGISTTQTHRAGDDVALTSQLFDRCRAAICEAYRKELAARRAERERKKAEKEAAYSWSPLLNKNFVFTGEFDHEREKLEGFLDAVGANLRQDVNGKTDYLVVGDLKNLPLWAVERKYYKAQEKIKAGSNIQIITETEYLKVIRSTVAMAPAK